MGNWLGKILRKAAGAVEGRPRTEVYLVGQDLYSKWDAASHARDGYERNAQYYRALQLIATAVSGIEPCVWVPVRSKGKRTWEKADAHPVLELLNHINPLMGYVEWLESTTLIYLLGGQVFNLCAPRGRAPVEMYPRSSKSVHPVLGEDRGTIIGYDFETSDGKKTRYPTESCWWFKSFSPSDPADGQPLLQAAADSIDISNRSKNFNRSVLRNGGVPGLKVTYSPKDGPQEMPADLKAEMRLALKKRYEGDDNAGRSMLLDGGLTADILGFSPDDMAIHETAKEAARDVAVAAGIGPELLGDAANKTYSNYAEARKALYTETVLPLSDRLYSGLTRFLRFWFPGEWELGYDPDDVEALKEDETARWNRINGAQYLSVDEKRQALGYDKLPPGSGGEMVLIPAAMVPLDLVVAPKVSLRPNLTETPSDATPTEDEDQDQE